MKGSQVKISDAISFLREFWEDPQYRLLLHNAKYDRNVGLCLPEPLYLHENIHDTQIAEWLLNTIGVGSLSQRLADKGKHGLKELVKHYFDYEMVDLKDIAPKDEDNSDVLRPDLVDIGTLGDYAIDDVVWLFPLYEKQKKEFKDEPRLETIYEKLERKFIFTLADLESFGAELDMDLLADQGVELRKEIEEIHRRMFKLRPVSDFEPMDPEKVYKLARAYEDLEEEDMSAYEKGQRRKEIFEDLEEEHPIEEKIRDDAIRPDILRFPEVAHKIFNPNSTHQLNQVLFEECGIKPIGRKTKHGLYSTNADNIEKWAEQNEIASELDRLRKITKLEGTYVEGMTQRLSNDGRIRTRYNRLIATGRLSSREPNLQNIVKSKEFPIRKAFVSTGISESIIQTDETKIYVEGNEGGFRLEDGKVTEWWGNRPPWVLMVADYSQLEIRLLAHASQDEVLINAILDGTDIHGLTASKVFEDDLPAGIDPNDIKEQFPGIRNDAKPINFGILYGMGANKLANTLGVSKKRAQEFIDRYLELYPGVNQWIEERHQQVIRDGYVETLLGRKRHIPLGPFADKQMRKSQDREAYKNWMYKKFRAQRIAQNTPIQGAAADVINVAMVQIREFCRGTEVDPDNLLFPTDMGEPHDVDFKATLWDDWIRMLIQVHDEIVFEFHPSIANWALDKMVDIMEAGFDLSVPLLVDANMGVNWHDTK